jgi:N-formylglutamate deformylase
MIPIFRHHDGELPLLVSVPHDGRDIPDDIRGRMTDAGLAIPDTDWHVAQLYSFVEDIGASTVVANYSRYVVDLNRPADDAPLYEGQIATGLCPVTTFAGDAIYRSGGLDEVESAQRVERFWRPYHQHIRDTLDRLRAIHGFALLWDAHSIPSVVPRLFEGELPELNLGSNNSRSCHQAIEQSVTAVATSSIHSAVVNGRFKGGYITRQYGEPDKGIHAMQLEIAQRAYMSEASATFDENKAGTLRVTLRKMLDEFLEATQEMKNMK